MSRVPPVRGGGADALAVPDDGPVVDGTGPAAVDDTAARRQRKTPGCRACRQLAHLAAHEPLLLDAAYTRLVLWRCSGCATLWNQMERTVGPVLEERADALFPGWRDHERWIRGTTLRSLLVYRGSVPTPLVRTALLHHDVLAPTGRAVTDGVLVVHSGADTVASARVAPDQVRVRALASALRLDGVRRLVVDPATPWALNVDGEPLRELVHAARSVHTWPSRARGDELRLSFPAPREPRRSQTGVPAVDPVPPAPPLGDPYAGREAVDEVLSAAVVAYLSYGRTPFPWADEQAVACLPGVEDVAGLVDRVRAVDAEMTGYEVDWVRHGYQGGCAEAAATLRARHPELGPDALAALDWAFSYRWR